MPVLGITGGVATGKSSFTRSLAQRVGAAVFDADKCAAELLAKDSGVLRSIRSAFGDSIFETGGAVNRDKLREIVFADREKRRELERILHPTIRSRWTALAENARGEKHWLLIDIPLLFETNAEAHLDAIVVVACTPSTQHDRMLKLRNLTEHTAALMAASQLDQKLKIAKAHHVIWNDSLPSHLEEQAALFASYLKKRYD